MKFLTVPKAKPGDKVAIVSPSFAAPAVAPAIHEQAMDRLRAVTGLEPVEYPSTRRLGATPGDRAEDINAAFADPSIRAILSTLGGDDQITVVPHLRAELAIADPKPFLGYSDNTNILNWLWTHGVPGFHGGSTQVHLGPGAGVDHVHEQSLRAALLRGGQLVIVEPGESEDMGIDWDDPRSLHENGIREPTEPWTWAGSQRVVTGRTWGGCVEVLQWLLTAGRFPADSTLLDGGVLLLETSEELISATEFGRVLRSLGERGVLEAVDAVMVARPPTTNFDVQPPTAERQRKREEQRDAAIDIVDRYNPEASIVVGPPFGHTRPQWILPYGGTITVDAANRTLLADYC